MLLTELREGGVLHAWLKSGVQARNQFETVHIDQAPVGNLQMRNDRQGQEGHLQEGLRQGGAQ